MSALIAFSPEERRDLTARLRAWLRDELEVEIGGLQAEMLLDEMTALLGSATYNRALYDAQALIAGRLEEVGETILGLEKAAPR